MTSYLDELINNEQDPKLQQQWKKMKSICVNAAKRKRINEELVGELFNSLYVFLDETRLNLNDKDWFDEKKLYNECLYLCDKHLAAGGVRIITKVVNGKKKKVRVQSIVRSCIDKKTGEEISVVDTLADPATTNEATINKYNEQENKEKILNKQKEFEELEAWHASEMEKIDSFYKDGLKSRILGLKLNMLEDNCVLSKEDQKLLRGMNRINREYKKKLSGIIGKDDLMQKLETEWKKIESDSYCKERDETIKELETGESPYYKRDELLKQLKEDKRNKKVLDRMWRNPVPIEYLLKFYCLHYKEF